MFRRQVGALTELYRAYGAHADFITIYIREAHANDEWKLFGVNADLPAYTAEGVCYPQPRTLAERLEVAERFAQHHAYHIPLFIDGMKNSAMRAFAAWPKRLYIVNRGAIAYRGGVNPFNYSPEDVKDWLGANTA